MTSSVDKHAVPPFYACYLLRSYATATSSKTYIGSTPDPVRRKKQHNGILSQGAHKTKRGRPWETQMLVFGFPSKIAALQFEWAWQKPYLSRHLRTHPMASGPEEQTLPPSSQHVALPLFTDTPLKQIAVAQDGCKGLPLTSVQTSLLVARALLLSEPFAGWGLRVVFFEEYLWAAWTRLESQLAESSTQAEASRVGLSLTTQQTRLGRNLPPASRAPNPVCDFGGVDGSRNNLLLLGQDERKAMKLDKTAKAGKGKAVAEGRPPGVWPEKLPRTLTVRAMGGTWAMLEEAPVPAAAVVQRGKQRSEAEAPSKTLLPRLHLDDEDCAFLAFKRFQSILDKDHIALEDVVPLEAGATSRAREACRACDICHASVTLRDHLTYSTCPAPFPELRHQIASKTGAFNLGSSLTRFGFGDSASTTSTTSLKAACKSVFHIKCLAAAFLAQQKQTGRFLLPTHGVCPSCHPDARRAKDKDSCTWNEVVRCMFRRRDYVQQELRALEAARFKAARLATQSAKKGKKGTTAVTAAKSKTHNKGAAALREGDDDDDDGKEDAPPKTVAQPVKSFEPLRPGLLGVLESLDGGTASRSTSSAAMLAAKRTLPSTWTPQPMRTAPSDRTNTLLSIPGDADDRVASSPTKTTSTTNASLLFTPSMTQSTHVRRPPPTHEVIDLT